MGGPDRYSLVALAGWAEEELEDDLVLVAGRQLLVGQHYRVQQDHLKHVGRQVEIWCCNQRTQKS